MAMDATSIAALGNAASPGYQAVRLAGSVPAPEDNSGSGDVAVPVQIPQVEPEQKTAESKPRGQQQDSKERNPSQDSRNRGQVHMSPIFRFDTDTQRMVMLSRDMDTGTVLFQIPTEEALRQYEETLKRQRLEGSPASAPAVAASAGREPELPRYTAKGRGVGGVSAGAGHASGVRFNITV